MHRTHLKDCTPMCLKFGKTSHPAVENLSCRTAKKWHSALWLNAMHSGEKTSDELRICPTLYFSLKP